MFWKNNSCPNFEKDISSLFLNNENQFPSIPEESHTCYNMGDEELARLWKYALEDVDDR